MLEQYDDKRVIRPTTCHTGARERPYAPLTERLESPAPVVAVMGEADTGRE